MKESYPVQTLCRVLQCARSSFYYAPVEKEEGALLAAMEQILLRWPFYGCRRMLAQLRREGWEVGERIVRRLLKFLGGSRRI
ncbi:MAG: transposase [Caldilineaceae bacterium]|nr:transposase [Caldilineaceae bacterium]